MSSDVSAEKIFEIASANPLEELRFRILGAMMAHGVIRRMVADNHGDVEIKRLVKPHTGSRKYLLHLTHMANHSDGPDDALVGGIIFHGQGMPWVQVTLQAGGEIMIAQQLKGGKLLPQQPIDQFWAESLNQELIDHYPYKPAEEPEPPMQGLA